MNLPFQKDIFKNRHMMAKKMKNKVYTGVTQSIAGGKTLESLFHNIMSMMAIRWLYVSDN